MRVALRLAAAPHAETGGSHGAILSLGRGLVVSMDALGAIEAAMAGPGGRATARTAPLRLHDGAPHEVAVVLSDGALSVEVDGAVRARAAAPGALPAALPLRLGAPEGGFSGEIDRLEITAGGAAPS
jgi:hypothetical protein